MSICIITWNAASTGAIEVVNGRLAGLNALDGSGEGDRFAFTDGPCRLEVQIEDERVGIEPNPTMVTVRTAQPFTFLLRDVNSEYPIFLPDFGAAVLPAGDGRSYDEVAWDVLAQGTRTKLQQIEAEPEESFQSAAAATTYEKPVIFLGISRDIRHFQIDYTRFWHTVMPRFQSNWAFLPEHPETPIEHHFACGRGNGCVYNLVRHSEDGELPILHADMTDEEVAYHFTAFVSFEASPLRADTVRGTDFLAAAGNAAGHNFTPEQQARFEQIDDAECHRDEETVLYHRITATNHAPVPRYAYFTLLQSSVPTAFDGEHGFGTVPGGVYVVGRLNGEPLRQTEVAVLLAPGESADFDLLFPHEPISTERAERLAGQNFDAHHAECRAFWQHKLNEAAQFRVPDGPIDEKIRAGLLHLDQICHGLEPDGIVAPMIGVYGPIGSESAPIIQFFDAAGLHPLARRSAMFFVEQQHDDGYMQNYHHYMLETGPALWTLGEHYRYTRDDDWVRSIEPNLLKACEYLLAWRERNKREELRGQGYGMIEGMVGDPLDMTRSYMLNGYSYLGMKRVAEMLATINPTEAQRIDREAEAWKADIRTAVAVDLARSPVVPLGDGTWCPSLPPWAGAHGPVSLYTDGRPWWTHGSVMPRDSLSTPIYLLLAEIIDPQEPAGRWIMACQTDLRHVRNTAFAQPYYSPHPLVHLWKGEVKAFLKCFYNEVASLADRDSHAFPEHYGHGSPHKTHEEAWFLLRARWMLLLEEGETLRLLAGAPRAWLEAGKRIDVQRAATYFGPVSFTVESRLEEGKIVASVECLGERKPNRIALRLPHPKGACAIRVSGGTYLPEQEAVIIEPFSGRVDVIVEY